MHHFPKQNSPCQITPRLKVGASDSSNPVRSRNYAAALAKMQLMNCDFDDYKQWVGENRIEFSKKAEIVKQAADYHAKKGDFALILAMVTQGILPEFTALQVLLDNRMYSEFDYFCRNRKCHEEWKYEAVCWHLIDLFSNGSKEEILDARRVLQVPYRVFRIAYEYAKIIGETHLKADLGKILKEAKKEDWANNVVGSIDREINELKRNSQ